MTDAWKKLWSRKVTPEERDDWLYEVKAEGDRNKEKAVILDSLEEMGVVTVYDSKHWSTDFNVLKEKAENYDLDEKRIKRLLRLNSIEKQNVTDRDLKLKAIKKQVIEPQLKDSKEYLDTHTKPEPHDIEMSRYWLEKGIYGTVSEIVEILGVEG